MVEDVVDVDSINSFVVKLEVTLFNNAWWAKDSVMTNILSLYSGVGESK
jgi:hypothetical protein